MHLNWVQITWSMLIAACFTLAVMHLRVWFSNRKALGNLLFSIVAVAAAAVAYTEILMIHAETPKEFATALRWFHVPVWVTILAIVGFIKIHMRAGRLWLAWASCIVRTLSLILNFLSGQNLNYLEVGQVTQIPFLGESVSVATGTSNPMMLVGQASLMLLLAYSIDATLTVWRRGDRRMAAAIGGSILFLLVASTVESVLVLWQIIQWPLTISLFMLPMLIAMSFEMSRDVIRSARLSGLLQAREADLRRSEQRLMQAADGAKLGVWEWDIDRDEVWVTDKFRELMDIPEDERIDFNRFLKALHPDERTALLDAVTRSRLEGGNYEREFRVMPSDGKIRWIATRAHIDINSSGKAILIRGVTFDISERKQSELEFEMQRNELAHLARVAILSEISGSLAHELNQPLTAILSNAQAALLFLTHDPANLDEVRDILRDIIADDRRAGEIIQGLRLLLKKEERHHEALDLNDVVQDALRLVRSELTIAEVDCSTELTHALPHIVGDQVQLQQVVLNLLKNGSDAMLGKPAVRRQLVVTTSQVVDGFVQVCVIDRGNGIAPDDMDRIFEPFYTTKAEGIGLGLGICRQIIHAHGGTLSVRNNSEGGACFCFSVPQASDATS